MHNVLQQLEVEPVALRHVELSPEVVETFGVLPSGSKYKLAHLKDVPVQHALIFCHGFRPAGIPLAAPFAANDNPHRPVYIILMRRGYLVASVSYRREGVIYADAVADVEEMRVLLREQRGVAGRLVVQGRSMGGAVCTLLNERCGEHYDGILTLGAALHVSKEADGTKPVFSHTPRTRQIFLSNVSELAVIEAYVSKCVERKPSVFTLQRFGHCACFDSELACAFDQLLAWIEQGAAPPPVVDATNYSEAPRDDVAFWDEERKGFWAPLSVSMYYTLEFPMTEQNWLTLGIRPRSKFTCELCTQTQVLVKEIEFAVDPFVGVEPGALIAYTKGIGQKSGICFHSTGTSLNTVAKDFGIRREGNAIFIPQLTFGKKKKSNN